MAILHDPTGVYTVDGDGRRRYGDSTSGQINGEDLFTFDPATGVLKLSADENVITALKQGCGEFPIKELRLQLPIVGMMHFHNIMAIDSLPRKDGAFFLRIE